jgi:hypothetical protein
VSISPIYTKSLASNQRFYIFDIHVNLKHPLEHHHLQVYYSLLATNNFVSLNGCLVARHTPPRHACARHAIVILVWPMNRGQHRGMAGCGGQPNRPLFFQYDNKYANKYLMGYNELCQCGAKCKVSMITLSTGRERAFSPSW